MQRLCFLLLILFASYFAGCDSDDNPVIDEFRGNPIQGNLNGTLGLDGSPYLAVDTIRVLEGEVLRIEPGVEIRFDLVNDDGKERAIPFIVNGAVLALGLPEAPITFTSGLRKITRGDWDGIWLVNTTDESVFEYCRFLYGAKYGRRYRYRMIGNQLDSLLYEYGCVTMQNASPTIKRCWFLAGGFHGAHCDSLSRPTIENCVFYDNAGHGIFVHQDADPHVKYNIIAENDDYGVYCRIPGENPDPRADLDLTYNIVWSNFSGEFNQLCPPGFGRIATVNANLDSCDYKYNLRLNPSFVNAEEWNFEQQPHGGFFELEPTSAAIDAGPEDVPNPNPTDPTRIELGIWPYTYKPNEIRRLFSVNSLEKRLSPYRMTSDVLLPVDQTLEIEAGVEVVVEGMFLIRFKGKVEALGTESERIVFRSASENASPGSWFGMKFEPGGADGSILSYTTISDARWGVHVSQRDLIISRSSITNCDSFGVVCDNFASPLIRNTYFENNAIASILCQYNSSPDILRNTIVRGGGYGIYARESSRPLIANNIFIQCAVDGIRLENMSNATILNNTIFDCGYFGVSCENNSAPDIRNNILCSNGDVLRGGVGIKARFTSIPTIEYNNFYDHLKSAVSISMDTTAIDAEINYWQDPKFQNLQYNEAGALVDWNFHLQPDSPLIDAGDPEITDREDGSRSDLGAYGGEHAP